MDKDDDEKLLKSATESIE